MDPRDLQNQIILYCDYIRQDAHKNPPKKHTPPKAAAIRALDAIIVSHVHKTTRPLPKFRAAKPTQQIASSSEASPTFGHANATLNDYHYSFL